MKQEGWLTYVTLIPVVTGIIIATIGAHVGLVYSRGRILGRTVKDQIGSFFYFPSLNFQRAIGGYGGRKDLSDTRSYIVQQKYIDLDIHVGQSYSFLVTMDQDASSDYYIVANPRFVNSSSGGGAVGVAALHYTDSQGPTSGSFKYGQITVTDVYVLVSRPAELIYGKWHATLNGLSYFTPSTPLTLAQLYKLSEVYKLKADQRIDLRY
ncbi:Monocopper oxidase-like protein SKU5 [Bienertia sinuspersici]